MSNFEPLFFILRLHVSYVVLKNCSFAKLKLKMRSIEYEIIGEGSQISTNQKPGSSSFSLLIG